jgi:hypothetical protein
MERRTTTGQTDTTDIIMLEIGEVQHAREMVEAVASGHEEVGHEEEHHMP